MKLLHADENRIIVGFDPEDSDFITVPELQQTIEKMIIEPDGITFLVKQGSMNIKPGTKSVIEYKTKRKPKTLDYRDFLAQNWSFYYIFNAPHPTLEDECECF